jgi:hypothetical protein
MTNKILGRRDFIAAGAGLAFTLAGTDARTDEDGSRVPADHGAHIYRSGHSR